MTKDLIDVADVDFNNVNITSIIVVFVIIAIVFRSASVPVLLVAAIESAIMINLGIPYFTARRCRLSQASLSAPFSSVQRSTMRSS